MSLDELSRKLERGGATQAQINEIKQIIGAFFSKQGIEVKTRLPDADAFADMETVIQFIRNEFGAKYGEYVALRIERFKIDVLSQTSDFVPSRDEVRDMVNSTKEKREKDAKSILERFQSGDY